ncbi:raftlin-2 [Bombina bombina]|uniref:raftlin-2 n=1 Tax=Bombina bombina TaxID=8345 RepID=UPI00235A84D3|nr:raftlin-2 [Bombina bombina]
MGCGLRKLEDPDDSSPGKIFSTLKRPQVETKLDSAYEYTLLDFSLEASSNPNVIRIKSLLDIPSKVEDYYVRGYVATAVHPVILSTSRRRHLPISYLYRVVLHRLKLSQKHTTSTGQRHSRLVFEDWTSMCETLTSDGMKTLLEKINERSKRGMKFVGLVTRPSYQSTTCNGTNTATDTKGLEQENISTVHPCSCPASVNTLTRSRLKTDDVGSQPMWGPSALHGLPGGGLRPCADESKNCSEGTLSGHSSESGIDEEIHLDSEPIRDHVFHSSRESSLRKSRKNQGRALYAAFNVSEHDPVSCKYHDDSLSMKVTRKGTTIFSLEADWLELTTIHYKQGFNLIDSFICWETFKGDQSPKSLEGLFIYEEEGSRAPGSRRRGNDSIIVEQWTVFEGTEIKTDYGPLLHTLAEFGWLLTCVIPTPIIRQNSEGNLTTKQIIFLQRPAISYSTLPVSEKKMMKQVDYDEKKKGSIRSSGQHTAPVPKTSDMGQSSDEFYSSASKPSWAKDGHQQFGSFSGFSSGDHMLRELDDSQFDQEDGVTQVTCM